MRIPRLFNASIIIFAFLLGGCDDYSEFTEVYERQPAEAGLDCMAVCDNIVSSDQCETAIACEDVLTVDSVPAVVCVFEYYNPPELH
jgi:hypothetical protein